MKLLIYLPLLLFSLTLLCSCGEKEERHLHLISEEKLGTLSLISYDGKKDSKYGLINLGHSFLSFKNESATSIFIGLFEVLPNEQISFGTWGMSSHSGVWYNLESIYIHELSRYTPRVSIQKGITSDEELSSITSFILENDKWNMYLNCTNFATRLWNTIAQNTEKINLGISYSPKSLVNQIKSFSEHLVDESIAYNKAVGYFQDSLFLTHEVRYA